ncbi:hypothetical protein MHU86_10110 [Fragilaria crotonensis]|nr:hypothetical protein MHU86_10110 [Fragilaria crotonensis]
MFGFLSSPCTVIVDSSVHVVACFVARVLRHPAVREVLESIVLASAVHVQPPQQLPNDPVVVVGDSNDTNDQQIQQQQAQQQQQILQTHGENYGTMTMKDNDHVSIDFTSLDDHKDSTMNASYTHDESIASNVHGGDGLDEIKVTTTTKMKDGEQEQQQDDASIPTTATTATSNAPQTPIPKTWDSTLLSPIIKSATQSNEALASRQDAQGNHNNNDETTLPTFFYKEIISSHTRHMIIVVEAPIIKDNNDRNHDDQQQQRTDGTTTTTTPLPDTTTTTTNTTPNSSHNNNNHDDDNNNNNEPNMLDLSISDNTTGRIVYQTPLTKDVKMAENLNDYADPDDYLWSITRRVAHRAAASFSSSEAGKLFDAE